MKNAPRVRYFEKYFFMQMNEKSKRKEKKKE